MENLKVSDELEITEEQEVSRPGFRELRPEWILGMVAVAAAVVLIVVLLMSRAYFPQKPVLGEEDPEALLHLQQEMEEMPWPPLEEYLEPTISETEPENPTIPPDRNP